MSSNLINRDLTSQLAVAQIGSCYDLVLVAATRLRQLRAGAVARVKPQYGDLSTALLEIEQGLVGREVLDQIPAEPKRRGRR